VNNTSKSSDNEVPAESQRRNVLMERLSSQCIYGAISAMVASASSILMYITRALSGMRVKPNLR